MERRMALLLRPAAARWYDPPPPPPLAGRKQKRVQRYEGGERAKYFADDDETDLKVGCLLGALCWASSVAAGPQPEPSSHGSSVLLVSIEGLVAGW